MRSENKRIVYQHMWNLIGVEKKRILVSKTSSIPFRCLISACCVDDKIKYAAITCVIVRFFVAFFFGRKWQIVVPQQKQNRVLATEYVYGNYYNKRLMLPRFFLYRFCLCATILSPPRTLIAERLFFLFLFRFWYCLDSDTIEEV